MGSNTHTEDIMMDEIIKEEKQGQRGLKKNLIFTIDDLMNENLSELS